mmetsp:Transcript_9409/g.20267  ORF Transcript_9409/g.20267 Transcript_9409/m.20267 type:complete len:228 (-) Transcript_9409:175-858(-)
MTPPRPRGGPQPSPAPRDPPRRKRAAAPRPRGTACSPRGTRASPGSTVRTPATVGRCARPCPSGRRRALGRPPRRTGRDASRPSWDGPPGSVPKGRTTSRTPLGGVPPAGFRPLPRTRRQGAARFHGRTAPPCGGRPASSSGPSRTCASMKAPRHASRIARQCRCRPRRSRPGVSPSSTPRRGRHPLTSRGPCSRSGPGPSSPRRWPGRPSRTGRCTRGSRGRPTRG